MVSVPTSTFSRLSGQATVASRVESSACAIVKTSRKRKGCSLTFAISASNKKFGAGAAPVGIDGRCATGCTGTIDQRTFVTRPASLLSSNAFRLLYVLSSNPEVGAWALIAPTARANSGCLATNAATLAGFGFLVAGSGAVASSCSLNASAVLTTNTGILFIPVRHSSPFGSENTSPRLRTVATPSGAYGIPPANAKRPTTGTRPGLKTLALDKRVPAPLASK